MNPFVYQSKLKAAILRKFGASVGENVDIKPKVNIKYPWHLTIGDNTWIGENVWIDSLTKVHLGDNVCLSQGAYLCCGSHDWSSETFDLMLGEISLAEGCWVGAKAIVLAGSSLQSHCVVTAGSVFSGDGEPWSIYTGNPARKTRTRELSS